jgi:hypothetical protein
VVAHLAPSRTLPTRRRTPTPTPSSSALQLAISRDMLWSPTIRAALLADTPWLDVFRPGCGTSTAIDLRTVDRHPLASIGTLVPAVLMMSWVSADAEADRAVSFAAS